MADPLAHLTDPQLQAVLEGDFSSLSDQDLSLLAGETGGPKRATSPFHSLDRATRTAAGLMATPFFAGATKMAQNIPNKFMEPMGVVGGGTLAQALAPEVPFSATLGSGAGASMGRAVEQYRRGENVRGTGGAFARGAGGALFGAGLLHTANAIAHPIVNAIAKTPFGEAAGAHVSERAPSAMERLFSNKAASRAARLTQQAVQRTERVSNAGYGAQKAILEAASPEAQVSLGDALAELRSAATSNPRTAQLLTQAGAKAGQTDLIESLVGETPPESLTIQQAAQLKEAINSIPGFMQKIRNPFGANWDVTEIPLVRFVKQLDEATDAALPGLESLNALHAPRKAMERSLKFLSRPGAYGYGGTPRLTRTLFRATPPQIKEAYQTLLPPEIQAGHRTTALTKLGTGIAGAELLRRTFLGPLLARLSFLRTEQ